jgi:hypothetical protein
VTFPSLAPPDWASLPGGDTDTSAQLASRDRRLAMAAENTPRIWQTADELTAHDALYTCSADALKSVPYAAQWYLDLAGMVTKVISAASDGWQKYGMSVRPDTIADNLHEGRRVSPQNIEAFCQWINAQLESLHPVASRTRELALTTVIAVVGARIQGQLLNLTGSDAVLRLKVLMIAEMEKRGHSSEVDANDGWIRYEPGMDLTDISHIRFDKRLECEFVPGGNRPDMRVRLEGVVVLNGEVKGRTDLSNVWESWMPQINGHLQTWTSENAAAPRVFFGTIITQEMIDGMTAGGTLHTGLRAFHRNGLLTSAYNLTNAAKGEPGTLKALGQLFDALSALLAPAPAKQELRRVRGSN